MKPTIPTTNNIKNSIPEILFNTEKTFVIAQSLALRLPQLIGYYVTAHPVVMFT